jgi:hypothetical protein
MLLFSIVLMMYTCNVTIAVTNSSLLASLISLLLGTAANRIGRFETIQFVGRPSDEQSVIVARDPIFNRIYHDVYLNLFNILHVY